MSRAQIHKNEYEIVAYPKLSHVQANIVHIINRNTHAHRALELCLALDGEAVVQTSTKRFPIRKGTLFFFNAYEPHQILASSQSGVKVAYLQVSSSFCGEYLTCFRNLTLPENDLSKLLTPEQLQEIIGLMVQALTDYLAEESDLYALRCICSICTLYSRLLDMVPYKQMSEATYLAQNKKMARLSRIAEYVDNHYSEKISLAELAVQEHVTTTYLSHFISDNLGMTFQEYVSSVRFERALKLLRNTSMCLTDVSVVSGFSDVKYLSRMLEAKFGKPAKNAWRQLCQDHTLSPQTVQEQTFASEALSHIWLKNFWQEYTNKET